MKDEIPRRMRSVENARGFHEFWSHVQDFMQANNFKHTEIQMVMELLNSFYFMGYELEHPSERK